MVAAIADAVLGLAAPQAIIERPPAMMRGEIIPRYAQQNWRDPCMSLHSARHLLRWLGRFRVCAFGTSGLGCIAEGADKVAIKRFARRFSAVDSQRCCGIALVVPSGNCRINLIRKNC